MYPVSYICYIKFFFFLHFIEVRMKKEEGAVLILIDQTPPREKKYVNIEVDTHIYLHIYTLSLE